MDYSVVQQCMHCGMCLPTCPTYDETKVERNSPRGRIALMRAIADGKLEVTQAFADEMYFCLGCLACETACPAGVDYTELFETARADAERSGVLKSPKRDAIRVAILKGLFTRPRLLRFVGRLLWLYRASGAQRVFRALQLNRLLPFRFRELERMTPRAEAKFSHQLIRPDERPAGQVKYRVGLLTGCVQDIVLSQVNRDTAEVLLANGCEVFTPPVQYCCGSLHAHNGDVDTACELARKQLDAFDLNALDAIITNAAGCGSALHEYHLVLRGTPDEARAEAFRHRVMDVSLFLTRLGLRTPPPTAPVPRRIAYHDACHLANAQGVRAEPRSLLRAIPGVQVIELADAHLCCGSAGTYNLDQPEIATALGEKKARAVIASGATVVASGNIGCLTQLAAHLERLGSPIKVRHTFQVLRDAYTPQG